MSMGKAHNSHLSRLHASIQMFKTIGGVESVHEYNPVTSDFDLTKCTGVDGTGMECAVDNINANEVSSLAEYSVIITTLFSTGINNWNN